MIAETVGPGLHPTALLATHTAPLPEPGWHRVQAGLPWELHQDAASPGPLPRSSSGSAGAARMRRAGLGQHQRRRRISLSKHLPILLHPSLAPACSCILGSLRWGKALSPTAWVQVGALLPALLPLGTTVPCHQQSLHEGLPWVVTDHQLGSCLSPSHSAWPLVVPGVTTPQTTNAAARDHHGMLQGAIVTGASLRCSAPSCTNSLIKRLVVQFTEDCKGTDRLALTKAEP